MSGAARWKLTWFQRVGADPEPWAEMGSDLKAEGPFTPGPGHYGSQAAQLHPRVA